jgi:hypothetical protein
MDPVSLALGIAPLAIGALKGAKHLRSKVKLLKNHDREVSRFRKKLRTQMLIFRDEYQLLLRDAGIGHAIASQMLNGLDNEDWTGLDVDEEIKAFLGTRYDEEKRTAEQIYNQVSHLDAELSSLEDSDDGTSERGKVSSISSRKSPAASYPC